MPYEYVWKPAPRNMGLPVSRELLDGFVENYVWSFVKQIRVASNNEMDQNPIVVFVCEHGAAKSILAAAYFNKMASETGSDLRAIARGTNPESELSPQTVKGLSEDGLQPTESTPQKLTKEDLESAARVIAFCELPVKYQPKSILEHWEGIPPVSENYENARDAIIPRIRQLLNP